jgi:hypothetical protein
MAQRTKPLNTYTHTVEIAKMHRVVVPIVLMLMTLVAVCCVADGVYRGVNRVLLCPERDKQEGTIYRQYQRLSKAIDEEYGPDAHDEALSPRHRDERKIIRHEMQVLESRHPEWKCDQ